MRSLFRSLFIVVIFVLCLAAGKIGHVYSKPDDFIKRHVVNKKEASKSIWLNKNQKSKIGRILGRPFKSLRIRYWSHNDKTVWVLSEIGKTKPITFGFVVKDKSIQKATVLVFRESRGSEIHHDFFTKQFFKMGLSKKNKLTRKVDGITGATLSVNAMKKSARLALYLDQLAKGDQSKQ